jgi:hypothetical protein
VDETVGGGELGSEVLFLGGRSGVGKSSVGFELHAQLSNSHVQHGLIEGDNLDLAYPPPWEDRLAERNLAAIWANYRELGYRKLIYTNTASVFPEAITDLVGAMGGNPRVIAVLLTCTDATARERLGRREIGSQLDPHFERSSVMARELDERAPDWVHRVVTDGRDVSDIAADVLSRTCWLGQAPGRY